MLRQIIGLLAMTTLATFTVAASPASSEDLVVIGRLKNLNYEHIEDEDDWLGHGWITAELSVKRVVRGKEKRRLLRVRYLAHTYLREDKSFRFRLKRAESVDYLICAKPGHSGLRCD
jgi:hypothetical protein